MYTRIKVITIVKINKSTHKPDHEVTVTNFFIVIEYIENQICSNGEKIKFTQAKIIANILAKFILNKSPKPVNNVITPSHQRHSLYIFNKRLKPVAYCPWVLAKHPSQKPEIK